MPHVRVHGQNGHQFLLHERIQHAFPDDFPLVGEEQDLPLDIEEHDSAEEPTEAATAVPDETGGETEGDQG